MRKASTILPLLTILAVSASADAKPDPQVVKLIQELQAKDPQAVRLAASGKPGCRYRNEYGNKYRREFTVQTRNTALEYEITYTDRGGKDDRGDCVIDGKDTITITVKYKRDSITPLQTEYTDDSLDARFLSPKDNVDFFCQKGAMDKHEARLLDKVMNSIESSYKCGFSYPGGVFHTHPRRHRHAMADYKGKVNQAHKYMKKLKQ